MPQSDAALISRLTALVEGGYPSADAVKQAGAELGVTDVEAWQALHEIHGRVLIERYGRPRSRRAEAIVQAERHYARCVTAGRLDTALQTLRWMDELLDDEPADNTAAAPCRVVRRVAA